MGALAGYQGDDHCDGDARDEELCAEEENDYRRHGSDRR
jgi:hypothetical protein